MKKFTRAIGAFAAAAALSASLGAVAFADDAQEPLDTMNFTVSYKASEGLFVPAKTFTYTIAPGAADDAANPKIYAGVGSIDGVEAVFAKGATEDATVTIDLPEATAFSHAGIYRYTIVQAPFSAAEVNAGILNEKGTGWTVTKYLDLYVDKDGNITNAILSDDGVFEGTNNPAETNYDQNKKSGGFSNTFGQANDPDDPDNPYNPIDPNDPDNPDNPDNPYNPDDPDNPDTPDPDDPNNPDTPDPTDGPGTPANAGKHVITLTKNVTGAMGDTNELFPFEFTLTSSNAVLAGISYTANIDGADNAWELGTTYGDVIKLKSGQSVTITVPNDVNVAVKELTSAAEGYTITSTVTGFNADPTTVTGIMTADTGTTGYLNNAEKTADVTYTNNRDNISPTGVALTFAPYLFIAAAGVAVFTISRRRKSEMEL